MEIIPSPAQSLLMTIPFVISYLGLHFILFKPLLAYLEERDDQSTRARRDAADYNAKVTDKMDLLTEQLADARSQAADVRADARARAQAKEQAILAEARASADSRLEAALGEIRVQKDTASAELTTMAATLSQDIATAVLGREISA